MMVGRKPAMRAKTPDEIAACKSCDADCWFGCETPIEKQSDPNWVVDYKIQDHWDFLESEYGHMLIHLNQYRQGPITDPGGMDEPAVYIVCWICNTPWPCERSKK